MAKRQHFLLDSRQHQEVPEWVGKGLCKEHSSNEDTGYSMVKYMLGAGDTLDRYENRVPDAMLEDLSIVHTTVLH